MDSICTFSFVGLEKEAGYYLKDPSYYCKITEIDPSCRITGNPKRQQIDLVRSLAGSLAS